MQTAAIQALEQLLSGLSPFREETRRVHREVRTMIAGLVRHARLDPDGPIVVLLFGGANTGKSTILNAFAGQDLSPVKALAGATRHLLVFAPEATASLLEDPALWPPGCRPERLDRPERLLEECQPRRAFIQGHQDGSLARTVLVDSPDITTLMEENARISSQALLIADCVVLMLTEEQHADQVLIDQFPRIRDLGKKCLAVFNRVPRVRAEQIAACQKFRMVWLENRMGDVPERFLLPRVAPGRAAQALREEATFQSLVHHLAALDRRDLLTQTRAGLRFQLAKLGTDLTVRVHEEQRAVGSALEELKSRYRRFIMGYNERRRWASRTLQVRSWLQSTLGSLGGGASTGTSQQSSQQTFQRFWRLFLDPLMGHAHRPSALEGLELMASALESDPQPSPLFRPLSRLARGVSSFLFGTPAVGRPDDPSSLTDALDLLEQFRCRFVVQEILPATLGPEWEAIVPPASGAVVADPAATLEAIAEEYRNIARDLTRRIGELVRENPGIKARLAQRHARLALVAGITGALALIDMGHSALALGVGLGAPVLWELMDWATNQHELNDALERFALEKHRWMERSFHRHVGGGVHEILTDFESRHDPEPLKLALRQCEPEGDHA
ncbi:MAG: 50S ribosome-binding GTPase [Candidatus Riflebacteria bacterium]|nr:50S ribosome-binding GTPase [Candidatus Riflebacteria bacterium]